MTARTALLVSTLLCSLFSPQAVAETKPQPSAPKWPTPEAPAGAAIRVNSIGFLPQSKKLATVAAPCADFSVLEASSGRVVFQGKASKVIQTAAEDTGEQVQLLDFSALDKAGSYVLEVPGVGRSPTFKIGDQVWNEAFRTTMRGFYLWRCGTGVDFSDGGRHYHQEPCHLQDGLLDYIGGPAGSRRPSTGGWHDAGDYNKYVVNAGVTVGLLFSAWEHNRPQLEGLSLQLPESGKGLPDLLAELRFEFDWLFSMQAQDGSAYHKLSALTFAYWGAPDKDTSPRYFTPGGSTATADFAAMMALGARHFREFDVAYAERCLAAARKAWAWLEAHPRQLDADLSHFHTGGYQAKDSSARLWAAYELWACTGEAAFLRAFETRAATETFSGKGPTWGDLRDLALGSYLLNPKQDQKDPALVKRLSAELLLQADQIAEQAAKNPHGRAYGDQAGSFYWGCNGTVAAQSYLLQIANRLHPKPEYREASLAILAYLFGRNYHGRSYVTGLGFNPPTSIHDRRGNPALPGYLVGGPWPSAKHWYDDWKDASRNEIAINWNATLLYAMAAFVGREAKP